MIRHTSTELFLGEVAWYDLDLDNYSFAIIDPIFIEDRIFLLRVDKSKGTVFKTRNRRAHALQHQLGLLQA